VLLQREAFQLAERGIMLLCFLFSMLPSAASWENHGDGKTVLKGTLFCLVGLLFSNTNLHA
jgi:hypothetical protein